MAFQDIPIRKKLMMVSLLTSGSVLLLTCAGFFAAEFFTFRQVTARQLSTLAQIIAANSTAALAFENQDDAREVLSALQAESHIVAAALYDPRGNLFAKYPATAANHIFPESPRMEGIAFEPGALSTVQPVVQNRSKHLGTLYLRSDLGAMYSRFRLYAKITAGVMAVSLLVAYLLSRAWQRQIAAPILALAETARAISLRNDYSVRAPSLGKDELGLLTDAFNQMLLQIQNQNASLREAQAELDDRVRQRTAQLQAANEELEAFSYSVSHDLRAPLRHIAGFVELLKDKCDAQLDDRGKRYLRLVAESVGQMGTLIDDLLSFSRMGRTTLSKSRVALDALVQESIRGLDAECAGRRIEWQIGELPHVMADPAMMRLVFANLLGNAVKYSRPREVARISVTATQTAEHVQIAVADNGVGFDMAYVGKLFGVFQRLHSANEFEGTGIGLANVRRIIERHGGRTWAQGAPDQGATMYFTLPLNT